MVLFFVSIASIRATEKVKTRKVPQSFSTSSFKSPSVDVAGINAFLKSKLFERNGGYHLQSRQRIPYFHPLINWDKIQIQEEVILRYYPMKDVNISRFVPHLDPIENSSLLSRRLAKDSQGGHSGGIKRTVRIEIVTDEYEEEQY